MLCIIPGLKRIREALKEAEQKSASADTGPIKRTADMSKSSVKEERAEPDKAVIVNSTSSPHSQSSEQLKGRDSPAPDPGSVAAEELVWLGCQAPKPPESLDSLIGTLRHQIRSSDWLEKNTPELSAGEDPEILDVFKALLQRARE